MNNTEIVNKIFKLLNFECDKKINIVHHEEVYVELKGNNITLGGSSNIELSRAAFLLAKSIKEGKKEIEISQKAKIKSCGVMVDVSRNAVMRVEAVHRLIEYMAALGLNMLMLYTEDTYEIEGRPYFGYMRGRYTAEELKKIVDYADEFGIEVIPCIQTLAHLGQYLKWPEAEAVLDMGDCMLVDEPQTYELIESMIKTCRKVFRTNRIHVGMDEAHPLGEGNYRKKFGKADKLELFTRHIGKVREICEKYNFRPMIWGDMFFRISSMIVEYVDLEVNISPEIASLCDGVDVVYWNFCHTDVYTHDAMIKKHEVFEGETVFASGIWTWKGFLPRIDYTRKTSAAALKAALKNNLQTVFAPMWNDFSAANHMFTIPLLAIYSEYMYRGEDVTDEDILSAGELISGIDRETTKAMDKAFFERNGKGAAFDDECGSDYTARADDFFLGDPFINLTLSIEQHYEILKQRFAGAEDVLKGKGSEDAKISELLLSIAKDKIVLYQSLRKAYMENDKITLFEMLEVLKNLVLKYKIFNTEFERIWMNVYKPFGFEFMHIKLGGVMTRCDYAARKLENYLAGDIGCIEELDECPLITPYPAGFVSAVSVSSLFV